jgi:hypothetical protein
MLKQGRTSPLSQWCLLGNLVYFHCSTGIAAGYSFPHKPFLLERYFCRDLTGSTLIEFLRLLVVLKHLNRTTATQ